ncbi:hypothetical protein TNCV_2763321 [Trichonephila clavipes]|nr:hypothetical protein TNCV_2763321 [Trichonephila clavipes]
MGGRRSPRYNCSFYICPVYRKRITKEFGGASGSTDLMASKVMFLRSNQGGRLDGNEFVADSFRNDLVGFKSWPGRIIGAFLLPLTSARKNPPVGSALATRGHPFVALSSYFR